MLGALHLRDQERGLLPAVDRGPPRGLLRAAVDAVRDGAPLPDLRQLPPTVGYAAWACHLLSGHVVTARLVDAWIARNLDAALEPVDPKVEGALPLPGCRTYEDLRNRLLVELDEMSTPELDLLEEAMRAAMERSLG